MNKGIRIVWSEINVYLQISQPLNNWWLQSLYQMIFLFLFLRYFPVNSLTLSCLFLFSPDLPTGQNLRWQLPLHQRSSCQPIGEHLVPGGEELAVGSVKPACGRSAASATFAKTWRSLAGRAAWSSRASWGSASRWVHCSGIFNTDIHKQLN